MTSKAKTYLRTRWNAFAQTPFGCLVRLFVGRMFHGGGETGAQELDLSVGVVLVLLAMPGLLVSLLMFEKYGSLIRFLRGDGVFDPFTATIPDEYFFIVLSMVVTGAAALWRWNGIFLDRRDYVNLVPLPVNIRALFLANLCAILVLAGIFTFVVNAASLVLFPLAVAGSQVSFPIFLRFAAGHIVAVFLVSTFSFFSIFAVAGLSVAFVPASLFRGFSLVTRFLLALWLLALLGSSIAVPQLLSETSTATARKVSLLPPVSFLGLSRTVWGRGAEEFVTSMTKAALSSLGLAIFIAILAYALSFRRLFVRIPETADTTPLNRMSFSWAPLAVFRNLTFRTPSQLGCFQFVTRTLLRSDAHLQILLGFLAVGLIATVSALTSAPDFRSIITGRIPPLEYLSVPFILSYCVVTGVRFAFEVPADLRANWIFRFWLDRNRHEAREVARRVLLVFCLSWLAPTCFLVTLMLWGWATALLHTTILIFSTVVLVEMLVVRLRKLPFTCSPPTFKTHSGIVGLAYFFGFLLFTDYLVQMERWVLSDASRALSFIPLIAIIMAVLHHYRRQMLDMDKELIFEEPSTSGF